MNLALYDCPSRDGAGSEVRFDILVAGDSSSVLVKDPFSASPSRHSFGHYVNVETIPGGRRVVHCHNWGRGLSDIVASIKTGINDLKKANAERDLEPLPIVVVIGWAGNDVYGEAGYAAVAGFIRSATSKRSASEKWRRHGRGDSGSGWSMP